jgi:protein-S-isoprenylcysteine O-methyltransferase Ste14
MPNPYLFLALWLILVAYWICGYFGNKRSVYVWKPSLRMFGAAVFIALAFATNETPAMHLRIYSPTPAIAWAGIAVCAAGLAFAIWARRTLGRNWSGAVTIKEDHELITRGPYRIVRHPIYTGILVGVLGTFIGTGRVREAVLLLLAGLAVFMKISVEERLMLRQFPEAYPEYRRRTRAIIPFLF